MKISTTVFMFIMFVIILLFNVSCDSSPSQVMSLLVKDVPPGSEIIQAPTCEEYTYIVRTPDGTVYLYNVLFSPFVSNVEAVKRYKYVLFTPPTAKTDTSSVVILPNAAAVDYERGRATLCPCSYK